MKKLIFIFLVSPFALLAQENEELIGKIGKTLVGSEEFWPEPVKVHEGANGEGTS